MTYKISYSMQSPLFPLPNDKLKFAYLQLATDIDSLIGSLISERFKKKLKCRPGCIECCINFSVLPLEAAFIIEAIKDSTPTQTDVDSKCPLLLVPYSSKSVKKNKKTGSVFYEKLRLPPRHLSRLISRLPGLGDHCSIYDIRPIICRTQGLPIAYIDEASGSIEVSACQINFADDYQFSQKDLLFMDQLNQRLAELNLQYCNATGQDPHKRVPLAHLISY